MGDGMDQKRRIGARGACLLATALIGVTLATGCGGASPHLAAATVASAGTTARRPAESGSTAPTGGSGPLAFARCMRANGVSNFPDPKPGGGFAAGAIEPASPAFRAAQSKCQKLMGGPVGGPLIPGGTTHPSAQTLEKLVRIAECMRRHGIADFPDPRTSVPSDPLAAGVREVTDFDGVILLFPATMNLQAPAYRQALTACGAPPLGLRH